MKFLRVLLSLAVLGVGIWQYFFAYGSAVKFGADEEVYYKAGATKQEAEAVGKSLQQQEFFDGKGAASVQVVRRDPGFAVRFVVKDGVANDAATVDVFAGMGYRLSQDALGAKPVTVELCDDEFHTVKSVPMKDMGTTLAFKGGEVRFRAPVTEEQARAVGDSLVKQGFFDDGQASVQLLSEDGGLAVQFVVNDGVWDKADMVDAFAEVGGVLGKDALKGAKVRVDLCDDMWRVKKSFPAK